MPQNKKHVDFLLTTAGINLLKVASSTLDASAKIYAGRVDAIHSETYKVLSGLGRGAEKKQNDEGLHVSRRIVTKVNIRLLFV